MCMGIDQVIAEHSVCNHLIRLQHEPMHACLVIVSSGMSPLYTYALESVPRIAAGSLARLVCRYSRMWGENLHVSTSDRLLGALEQNLSWEPMRISWILPLPPVIRGQGQPVQVGPPVCIDPWPASMLTPRLSEVIEQPVPLHAAAGGCGNSPWC